MAEILEIMQRDVDHFIRYPILGGSTGEVCAASNAVDDLSGSAHPGGSEPPAPAASREPRRRQPQETLDSHAELIAEHHLEPSIEGNAVNVRVGLCGFTMSMQVYARYFPVVEVQSTFYEPPQDATMRKWLANAGPNLEYTMKVWQLVTHPASSPTYRRMKRKLDEHDQPGFFRDSPGVQEGWRRSIECAGVLSATAMLFQCPASFTPARENIRRMRSFFERIERPKARLLWEPRGPLWIAERQLSLALCKDLDLVRVVDPFVSPADQGHSVYWRLHGPGSPRASYDQHQLDRLHRMLLDAGSCETAYVLFNNLPRVDDPKRFAAIFRKTIQ